VVALVNMGAAVTNINVLARGQSVFWRDISFGGNQFTEALQREFNLSFEAAEALKRGEPVDRYRPGRRPAGARLGVRGDGRGDVQDLRLLRRDRLRGARSTSWCSRGDAR
jgi:hypothetical protein